jgi:anti-sigma B factor antagonist
MNLLEPKVEKSGNVTIITLTSGASGEVGNRIASELEGRTEGLGQTHLPLDFSNVERINSEELGTLVGLHQRVKALGGRLTLFNLSADIYEVFAVTHLQTLLGICREQAAPPASLPERYSTAPSDLRSQ